MKINFNRYGSFEFIAEDGKDELWLEELCNNMFPKRKELDGFFEIDMVSMCVDMESGKPMEDCNLTEVFNEEMTEDDKDYGKTWGGIVRVLFNPFGDVNK